MIVHLMIHNESPQNEGGHVWRCQFHYNQDRKPAVIVQIHHCGCDGEYYGIQTVYTNFTMAGRRLFSLSLAEL